MGLEKDVKAENLRTAGRYIIRKDKRYGFSSKAASKRVQNEREVEILILETIIRYRKRKHPKWQVLI